MYRFVADTAGVVNFFVEVDQGETSSFVQPHAKVNSCCLSVPVVTLDKEMEAHRHEQNDMVRIDAEGFDMRVLLGARRLFMEGRVRVVQFEYNFPWPLAGSSLSQAFELFREADYVVSLLKRGGLYCVDPGMLVEYYRYSNFIATGADRVGIVLAGAKPLSAI